jgi:ornithine cyclodeaminase/alanine dehydrogenase-like protein (mu-crystallin family)
VGGDALLLTEHDVRAVLAEPGSTLSAIDAMEAAFAAYGRGELASPPRVHVDHPPGSGGERSGRSLRVLPCVAPAAGGAACRVYTMNKDAGAGAPAPCELILLFDGQSLELRAVIEDYSLHALRTGASTAVALRVLAPRRVDAIGVIGTGRQAGGQLAAAASVCAAGEIRVFGRDEARREAFAAELSEALGRPVRAVGSARDAVRDAGVVLVATNTAAPALERDWLRSDAVVASIAPGELAPEVVLGACVVPCAAEEVLSGTPRWEPVRTLVEQGRLAPADLAPGLGELVAGTRSLGRDPGQPTVFLNTGMAFWDVAIADWVDRCARRLGLGAPFLPGGGTRTGTGFVPPRASAGIVDG